MPVVLYECVPATNSFAPPPAKITEFGIFPLELGVWDLEIPILTAASPSHPAPKIYFAGFTIAMPHGPLPTLTRFNSLRAFTSTTDTSSDAPFAV
jgi:hypothetical protein